MINERSGEMSVNRAYTIKRIRKRRNRNIYQPDVSLPYFLFRFFSLFDCPSFSFQTFSPMDAESIQHTCTHIRRTHVFTAK